MILRLSSKEAKSLPHFFSFCRYQKSWHQVNNSGGGSMVRASLHPPSAFGWASFGGDCNWQLGNTARIPGWILGYHSSFFTLVLLV